MDNVVTALIVAGVFIFALCLTAPAFHAGGIRTGTCQQVCWSTGAKFIETDDDARCWCEPAAGSRILLTPIKSK